MSTAAQFADARLRAATVKGIVDKAMNGTLELTFKPALRSASAEGALRGYQKVATSHVADWNDRKARLFTLDHVEAARNHLVAHEWLGTGARSTQHRRRRARPLGPVLTTDLARSPR